MSAQRAKKAAGGAEEDAWALVISFMQIVCALTISLSRGFREA